MAMYSRHREHADAEKSQGMRRPDRSTMPAKKMNEPRAVCKSLVRKSRGRKGRVQLEERGQDFGREEHTLYETVDTSPQGRVRQTDRGEQGGRVVVDDCRARDVLEEKHEECDDPASSVYVP
jgi:hypothetical protein